MISGWDELRAYYGKTKYPIYYINIKIIKFKLIVCPGCGMSDSSIKKRRLNTAYVDNERNYMTSCEYCYEEACSMYEELWHDYYSGLF